jgi:hypothetical protein
MHKHLHSFTWYQSAVRRELAFGLRVLDLRGRASRSESTGSERRSFWIFIANTENSISMDISAKEVPELMKLQGAHNYIIWCYKVMMTLMQEGWWSFILPEEGSDGSSTSSGGGTVETMEETSYGVARPRPTPNRAAQHIKAGRLIISTLGNGVIIHLTNPKETWNRLDAKYNVKGSFRRLALKKKLYSLRLLEGKSLDSHLQEINLLVHQLARLGTTVEEEDLVNLTLNSLPKSWATFISIHKASPPSFPALEGLLVQEDLSRDLDKSREESEEVLYVKNTSQRLARGRSAGRTRGRGRSYQGTTV